MAERLSDERLAKIETMPIFHDTILIDADETLSMVSELRARRAAEWPAQSGLEIARRVFDEWRTMLDGNLARFPHSDGLRFIQMLESAFANQTAPSAPEGPSPPTCATCRWIYHGRDVTDEGTAFCHVLSIDLTNMSDNFGCTLHVPPSSAREAEPHEPQG